jgi:hypothetical protein
MEKKPRIFTISFGSVYPLYVQKAVKKGRTQDEVDEIIMWLTGYSRKQLQRVIDDKVDLESFFAQAPQMNPKAGLITGVVCGKLIDELAKGKKMASILRQ